MLSRCPSRLHSTRVPISLNSTLASLNIPTSRRQHMIHHSLHQSPTIGLHMYLACSLSDTPGPDKLNHRCLKNSCQNCNNNIYWFFVSFSLSRITLICCLKIIMSLVTVSQTIELLTPKYS
jgi:hypothetical protein